MWRTREHGRTTLKGPHCPAPHAWTLRQQDEGDKHVGVNRHAHGAKSGATPQASHHIGCDSVNRRVVGPAVADLPELGRNSAGPGTPPTRMRRRQQRQPAFSSHLSEGHCTSASFSTLPPSFSLHYGDRDGFQYVSEKPPPCIITLLHTCLPVFPGSSASPSLASSASSGPSEHSSSVRRHSIQGIVSEVVQV